MSSSLELMAEQRMKNEIRKRSNSNCSNYYSNFEYQIIYI